MSEPRYLTQPLQDLAEPDAFLGLLRTERVRSYLEIGVGYGGSFWRVGTSLPRGARVVGIDLYAAGFEQTRLEFLDCVSRLNKQGYDARLLAGNSTDPPIIAAAAELAPFDCLFIDGDHTYEGARADWTNYAHMARIVAFHDISWNSTWQSKVPGRVVSPIGVPTLWAELKQNYRHQEIRLYKRDNYYGIGVLWMP